MFALTPVSALHSGYGHYRQSPRDRYLAALAEARAAEAEYAAALAQEEAIRRQRYQEVVRRQHEEAIARRQRQDAIRRQTLLDAFRNHELNYVVGEDDSCAFAPCGRPSPNHGGFAPRAVLQYPQPFAHEEQARQQNWERRVAYGQARRQEWERQAALQRARSQERREEVMDRRASRSPVRPQHAATEAPQVRPSEPIRPLQERLENRLLSEYEQEIKDTLASLLSSLNPPESQSPTNAPEPKEDAPTHALTPAAEPKGKEKEASPVTIPISESTPKEVSASLDTIRSINAEFEKLSSEFELPRDLDFDTTPSTPVSVTSAASGSNLKLTFTARNAPVRFFEHALGSLLSKLDTVESFDDEQVRSQRKATVTRVEKALEDLEKAVEERFEAFKWKEDHERKVENEEEMAEVPAEEQSPAEAAVADAMEVDHLVSDKSPEAISLPVAAEDVDIIAAASEDTSLPAETVLANNNDNAEVAAAVPEEALLPSDAVLANNHTLVSEPIQEHVAEEVVVEERTPEAAASHAHEEEAAAFGQTSPLDPSTAIETEQTSAAENIVNEISPAPDNVDNQVLADTTGHSEADIAADIPEVKEASQMVVETDLAASSYPPAAAPDTLAPSDPEVTDVSAPSSPIDSAASSHRDQDEAMADTFLLPTSDSHPSTPAPPHPVQEDDDVVVVEDILSSESSGDAADREHEDGWCEVDA